MFPNMWTTSIPPPVVTKPMVNPYETSTQSYSFYATPNQMHNVSMNQQNSSTINAASVMTQSLQPNAIDPALVQKWHEWKQWEEWRQRYQQWQQQTGQIAVITAHAVPPMPPSQPIQASQTPTISFQNLQYPYNPQGPPLPPITNQPQEVTLKNEVGTKRELEPEFQNDEKKLKMDTTNKKEIELNDETEALFEEQFKSWEEQFFKWKEQNKNHPDKVQYLEYEKKWIAWRDHLKQKCEILKKKKEMKMAEKKKETIQAEENRPLSQQMPGYNPMMPNTTNEPPPTVLQLPNSSLVPSTSENQIPGLDFASNNENANKGFLNVSNILTQNQNGPIQTPDDKPFNFPKSITSPSTINLHPINMPHSNMSQPQTSMYQNSSSWSKYNNPVLYGNQKPPDIDNTSISRFGQQTDNSSRLSYGGDPSNTTYTSTQNVPNIDYRRSMDGSYNKSSSESNPMFNKPPDDESFNRNFNAPNNFRYNQPNLNTSNFNRPIEKSNIPYQQHQSSPMNTTSSKPPSLLSLNLVKPVTLDKPGNYSENMNIASDRYERNWNIADEEEDAENEYMEAHKKFSSEPFGDQNDEDQFPNVQHRNMYNENHTNFKGQQGTRNFNNDYPRPFNQSRGSQMMRNTDNEFVRPNSQFSRNTNQNFPREMYPSTNNENYTYKSKNHKNVDQGFPRGASLSKDIDEEYFDKPAIDKNNFVPQKGNFGPPSRGNYDLLKGNFGRNTNRTNMKWNENYSINEDQQQPVNNTIVPAPIINKPYEEPQPIDPVKIFDYRHLPTLKVIPGLSKETIIPIRIYDHKHGGKRILPWQDRGFSRRNLNQTRDLNEKEVLNFNQDKTDDLNMNREELPRKTNHDFNDTSSSNDKNLDLTKNEVEEIKEENTSTIKDTIIVNNAEKKEETSKQEDEVVNICAPSPPKMSINIEIEKPSHRKLLTIETLLCPPGRLNRPDKIVIILRGLPGSGKSYVAKLIKEKEVAMGGQAPRILSLDDYFMTEVTKTEIDSETNKKVEKKVMEYEYDSTNENLYRTSFVKAFKKKMLENYFSFYIIDAINNKVSYYKEIIEISRMNGFTVYIIELETDVDLCIKRNIHNRTAHDINSIMRSWVKTPDDQILLDIQSLLHITSQSEMEMEDVSDVEMELDKDEDTIQNNDSEENKNVDFEEEDVMKLLSCKWTDTIPQEEKMKRLDGLCKKKTESSIKEWLQIPEDYYTISEQVVVKDGKKRVRWADMEERLEQEKMRAIGFVVGQTDWDRMLGRDQGESKLTQTKYI